MSEPRTQHEESLDARSNMQPADGSDEQLDVQLGMQPSDESDEQLDALLKDALSARRMPPGLAEKTMARIRAQAAVIEGTAVETGASKETAIETAVVEAAPAEAPRFSVVQAPTGPIESSKSKRAGFSARSSARPASRHPVTRRRFVQLMAACIATSALAVGGGALAFADETAQVEIDGSALAELGLNRWERVVRVWASSDALSDALGALGLIGMSCEDALNAIAADVVAADLLTRDRVELVACSGDASQMESVYSACSSAADGFGAGTSCSTADPQTRAAAREAGMGVARYQVFCQITAIDSTYTTETCSSMSMRELRDLLAGLTGETPEGAAGHGHGSGSGSGNGGGHGQGMGAGVGMGSGMGAGAGTSRGQGSGGGRGAGMGRGNEGEHEE